MRETVPFNRRLYQTWELRPGAVVVRWSAMPPPIGTALLAVLERGMIEGGATAELVLPLGGARVLGTITIAEKAAVAIQAGQRRVTVKVPAAWGLAAGDAVTVAPVVVVPGYTLHDVVVTSASEVSIGLSAPLLAINASYSLSAKLIRLG